MAFNLISFTYIQFEDSVMKASLKLLNMGKLTYREHRDPVAIARHMSGLVNSNVSFAIVENEMFILLLLVIFTFFSALNQKRHRK